jgi:DNA-binding MarR family transcriptional regulator
LEVTQQAASKTVSELEGLGYVEKTESEDARVRRVALSAHGRAAVEKGRAVREALQKRFERQHGARAVEEARRLLADVLTSLGGAEAVRARRVRAPR